MGVFAQNPQLTARISLSGEDTSTATGHRLYKLNALTPARPCMIRVPNNGVAFSLEVWKLPLENYAVFVAGVPAPLGFGTLKLFDGSAVQGFLCEYYATLNAIDISDLGGWRSYLNDAASTK